MGRPQKHSPQIDGCDRFLREISLGQVIGFLEKDGYSIDWSKAGSHASTARKKYIAVGMSALIIRHNGIGLSAFQKPWGWTGPQRKRVFNLDVEGRDFSLSQRILIPATRLYGYMGADPAPKRGRPPHFGLKDHAWFWIMGVMRKNCFAMLSAPARPEILPHQQRQVCALPPELGLSWLTLDLPQHELIQAADAQFSCAAPFLFGEGPDLRLAG